MTTLATVEIVCAVFLAILFITQKIEKNKSKSSRLLNLCILLVLFILLIDVMAYSFMDDSTPFAFRYAVCLLAYMGEGICFLGFAFYSEAFFAEKTEINPRFFRILKIAEIIWIAVTAVAFVSGKMVVFENGVEVADNGYPVIISVYQIAIMLYTPILALRHRKELGNEAVILISFFNIAPIAGIIAAIFAYYDYSYVIGAAALAFITEFIQRRETLEQQVENDKKEILSRNNAGIMALEDEFESLYDVDLETGNYEVFIKGQTYGDITSKIVYLDDFFADTIKNVELVVHTEDRAEILKVLRTEYIRKALSENNYFDTYYRLLADGKPIWVKMRIIYKDESRKHIIVGVFNAEEEMQRRNAAEQQIRHAEFRASALANLVENESDITAFLDFYAEKLRELMKCDQVIYRDENGNRYIKNAPQIGDDYEISAETCANCTHSDIHSPIYAGGVMEMEDTASEACGVPVHRDCPVKSSIVRTVSYDGEVHGYLALHYILSYHEFSDNERRTFAEFANLLSLLLSRYTARAKNAQLEQELDLKRQIESQKEQLEVQQKQLEEALSMAQSASKAKTDFLFSMSHDIRTPMNAILGYTDIALNHMGETERVNDSLKKIKISGGHLLSLINDILEMSRIEAGKLEIVNSPLNIYSVTDGVTTMSQSLAATKDITFITKIGELKNQYIYADELHINQIIINLISNAVKYTNPGGTVEYSIDQLTEAADGIARYRVTVKDNGIGMSEEFQKHLFESFAREQTSTVSRQEGSGLGLSIVKRIVDVIGGSIDVESEKDKGSVFTVELPVEVMDEEAIRRFKAESEKDEAIAEEYDFTGKKILLVEDNEMNREIATEILEETGLIIETAEDGEIALRKVSEKGTGYYDFILMDIQMPVMNGYEATAEIRKLQGGESIPIIALSANAFEEDKQKSLAAGMNAHVAKPIDIKELFTVLSKFM